MFNDAIISLGQKFYQTSDTIYLHKAINYLMTANKIHPNDGRTFANLVKCYYNLSQKDSVSKYLELADKQAPELIPLELRKDISN